MEWLDEVALGIFDAMKLVLFGVGFRVVGDYKVKSASGIKTAWVAIYTAGFTGLIATLIPSSPTDSLIQNLTCALLVCLFAIGSKQGSAAV